LLYETINIIFTLNDFPQSNSLIYTFKYYATQSTNFWKKSYNSYFTWISNDVEKIGCK